jgi:hypothetical protein
MPNRTLIVQGKDADEGQLDTLLRALKQKLKHELADTALVTCKTV